MEKVVHTHSRGTSLHKGVLSHIQTENRPIAEREKREKELAQKKEEYWHYRATHDPLTDSLNRLGIFERTNQLMTETVGHMALVLMLMDVNKFKVVNDRFGHKIGDMILIGLCDAQVQAFKRKDDRNLDSVYLHSRPVEYSKRGNDENVGRLGGDEIVIINKINLDPNNVNQRTSDPAQALAFNVSHAENANSLYIAGLDPEIRETKIGVTVGGALWLPPGSMETPEIQTASMLEVADKSMYAKKPADSR